MEEPIDKDLKSVATILIGGLVIAFILELVLM